MALELKAAQNIKVPAGSELIRSGSRAEMLILLHQGEALVQMNTSSGPKHAYGLGANSCPGFAQLMMQDIYPGTVKARSDCVISTFPVRGGFQNLIMGKLNVGMIAARSLAQEAMQSYQTIKNSSEYLAGLQKVIDNLSIVYFRANPQAFRPIDMSASDLVIDPVLTSARYIVNEYKENGGQIPDPFAMAFLEQDNSGLLKKIYEYESEFNAEEFNFLRRLLALPLELQGNIYKTDVQILQGLCRRLSEIILQNVKEILQIQESIDVTLENLVQGEFCYVEKYFLLSDTFDAGLVDMPLSEFLLIVKALNQSASGFLTRYQQLFGHPFPDVVASLPGLKEFIARNEGSQSGSTSTAPQSELLLESGIDPEMVKSELSGSVAKILNFSGLPAEEGKKIMADLKKLSGMSNPLDSGGDPRKVRRQITGVYWKIFQACFARYREKKGDVPTPVRMMLQFGFFDETLLDTEHLLELYTFQDRTKAGRYPVFNAMEWLHQVASKKELPSIDEMGQTFFEKLKMAHKELGWKRESDVPDEYDNYDVRVKYETENFLDTNVRLTSGSPATAFPILTRYQITLPLSRALVTREKLAEELDKILAIDFSAFHREVLINDEAQGIMKEFVQMQVIPNFIIVPSIGNKVMMWQDLSGRSKNSRGRFSVPVFATADLFSLLLDAVGAFRWELTKSIMGPDWNNVSQPSITADYTDYIQFFKKNRDLSQEQKEKLAVEFKRFRNDRDRFVNDYTNWIKFESEGILKLNNKIVRGVFYRHVPFAKDIRDKVATQPAYADLQNRFRNIRMRKIKELEVRYRKFGESIPDVLRNNMNFYSV